MHLSITCMVKSRVTLYTAGHLHTAVPHCSHSRAPIVHTAVLRENNEHGCVYLRCRAVCKLPGCVEGHPWIWAGHLSRPAARCNAVQRCRPACCNAVPSSSNVVQLLSKSGLWCHSDFNIVTAMGIVAQRWALFSKHLTSAINQPHIQAWLTCYVIIDYR